MKSTTVPEKDSGPAAFRRPIKIVSERSEYFILSQSPAHYICLGKAAVTFARVGRSGGELLCPRVKEPMARILDSIDSPEQVKQLSIPDLQNLAAEIRDELVAVLANTGGHLVP